MEPHFIGTTRSAFSLKMAEASLVELGATPPDDAELDSPDERSPQSAQGARKEPDPADPLLSVPPPEARRLLAVFRDDMDQVYPVLLPADLESRIPNIYERARTARPGRRRGSSSEHKEFQLLKVVLSMALVMEEVDDKTDRAELGRALMDSAEAEISRMSAHSHVDLTGIRLMAVMALNHFFRGEEVCAWRVIGLAGRFALEMGLHRRQSLFDNFADPQERTTALCLFWCVYVLDRRWSFGTGLSFTLHDRDIDPDLPEIVSHISRDTKKRRRKEKRKKGRKGKKN